MELNKTIKVFTTTHYIAKNQAVREGKSIKDFLDEIIKARVVEYNRKQRQTKKKEKDKLKK